MVMIDVIPSCNPEIKNSSEKNISKQLRCIFDI